jgi:hypothetical protein
MSIARRRWSTASVVRPARLSQQAKVEEQVGVLRMSLNQYACAVSHLGDGHSTATIEEQGQQIGAGSASEALSGASLNNYSSA